MDTQNTVVSVTSTGVGAIFTAIQTNPVYQTISLIVTIIGLVVTLISSIIIPIIRWYREAKKDGTIDDKEKDNLLNIIDKGAKDVKTQLDKKDEPDQDHK